MAYETLRIDEMERGRNVEGFFILRSAGIRTSTSGAPYMLCSLSDVSGEITGKMWNYEGSVHESVGEVIKIRGQVEEYNSTLQINIKQVRLLQPNDHADMSLLLPPAPYPLENFRTRLECCLGGVRDKKLRELAEHIYGKNKEQFLSIPAAKSIHHAFPGGLLAHTVCMMDMAASIDSFYSASVTETRGGSLIDLDLLLVGCFCHDIGKLKEFECSTTGLVRDYSLEGNLLGHSALGAQEVADAAREIGLDDSDERVTLLKHMLISHHGEPEFGAAVKPMFLEAEILSRLDMLDSRIEIYAETLETLEPGGSVYVNALEHRVYKPRFDREEE